MAKKHISYLCRNCGGVQSTWMGKCPDCGTWDALEKYTAPSGVGSDGAAIQDAPPGLAEMWLAGATDDERARAATATPLPDVEASDVRRKPAGIREFDRALGGGLVPGSAILLGGEPGIGKSTLLLQVAGHIASGDRRVLYVSSEESAFQTRLRAERLFPSGKGRSGAAAPSLGDLSNLYILAETNLARIVDQARRVRPDVLIVDSIQMVYKQDIDAAPGSIAQLRRSCLDLVYVAKLSGMVVILVGHVTKEGQLAGPKLIEHLVDTVLSFEGDRHHAHRVVRAIKNRFGNTLEVALFEMTGEGLREIDEGFLAPAHESEGRCGSIICPAMHGSRALLVEIQALTASGFPGNARRKASGVDANRLAMLIAVLEKHAGLRLADQDIFASAAGGLKIAEPAADLALALAIAGAHSRRTIGGGVAVIGEVGLGGEIRRINAYAQRMRECVRLGYETVVAPAIQREPAPAGITLLSVATVAEAVDLLHADRARTSAQRSETGSGSAKAVR